MAIITMPSTLKFDSVSFGQVRYDMLEMSEATGAENSRLGAPPRWGMSVVSGDYMTPAEWGVWAGMVMSLRGRVNHLLAWDPIQLAPAGTMRGTMTLSASAAAGAVSISVTAGSGQAATTLTQGDRLQIGTGLGTSQVVMVMANATANGSGVISLTVEPPLRYAFSSSAAVAWSTPSTYFKLQNDAVRWKYNRTSTHKQGGFSLDLLEAFG